MRLRVLYATATVCVCLTAIGVAAALGATRHVTLNQATRALVRMSGRREIRVDNSRPGVDPSGVPAPEGNIPGWRQIYVNQFNHPAPLGSFGDCLWGSSLARTTCPHLPRADRRSLAAYDDWIIDTQGTGRYMPSKVLSIHNGYLDFNLHQVDGTPAGAVVAPKIPSSDGTGQTYGAYAVRFRADSLPGYHLVIMLWADGYSHGIQWPDDGEFDFPEGDLNTGVNGFFHYSSPAGPQQYAFQRLGSFTSWHTAVIEWTPTEVHYIMDGRIVATISKHIPSTPMHLLLQAETGSPNYEPPASVHGHIQVAWVAAYKPQAQLPALR